MSVSVREGEDREAGDDLAASLFRVLSQLVGPRSDAVAGPELEERLDLIRWLQVELATAERLLTAARPAPEPVRDPAA